MEFQRKMDTNVQELFDKLEAKEDSISVKALPSRGFFSIQSKIFSMPDWFYKWSIIFGLIRLPLYGFYLVASLWFYLMKKRSIMWFYMAVELVIVFTLLKAFILMLTETFFGYTFVAESLFMLVVNIVLILVFALSDKQVFVTSNV